MALGREYDDLRTQQIRIEIRDTRLHGVRSTAGGIVLEHVGETLLEIQGDTFTHDAHTVDRVDEGVCLARKDVPY